MVLIDSGMAIRNGIVDAYGEMIVRPQLKGVVDFYCVASGGAYSHALQDCVKRLPPNIEYVDLIALTHTGGIDIIESVAKEVIAAGKRPELMISIGCYDSFARMADPENTSGPKGTAWSVHYYLFSMIAKRLRGIPMQEASNQAFIEGIPLNVVNPVSLAGMIGVSLMDGDWTQGYAGSEPDVRKRSTAVRDALVEAWAPILKITDGDEPASEAQLDHLRKVLSLTQTVLSAKRQWVARRDRRWIDQSQEFADLLFVPGKLEEMEPKLKAFVEEMRK